MLDRIYTPTRRMLIISVIACCLVSLGVQYALFDLGFVAASADESARALIAWNLSWETFFVPQIWPPFYEIAVGLAYRVHPDLFYTPRLVSTVFGLMSLICMATLAWQMFQSRLVAIIAAILGLFLSHRLLLSIAPMSEIFFNFFVIAGCTTVVYFGRSVRPAGFIVTALMFMLSATVRFEGWFLCAAFVLITGTVQLWSRPVNWPTFVTGAVIACAFPILWIGLSFYHFGDLSGLTAARDQNSAAATNMGTVIKNSHLSAFVRDFADTVLLTGAVTALVLVVTDKPIRLMLFVSVLGLLLASVAAIVTQSNPLAAPWRIAGAWTSLLIPFTAYGLVWVAGKLPRAGRILLPLLVAMTAAGLIYEGSRVVRTTMAHPMAFGPETLNLRAALQEAGAAESALLVDVDNVDFLHLVVALNRPEVTRYSTGSDPIGIALYVGQRAFWQKATDEKGRAIYDQYVSLKLDFADGPEALKAHDISHVLVKDGARRKQAEVLSWLVDRGQFSQWRLYAVQ